MNVVFWDKVVWEEEMRRDKILVGSRVDHWKLHCLCLVVGSASKQGYGLYDKGGDNVFWG